MPWPDEWIALSVWGLGFIIMMAALPLRSASGVVRVALLAPLIALFAAAPFLLSPANPALRSIVAILVGGVFPAKLIDLHMAPEHWRGRPWREWLLYLVHPIVLVHRAHVLEKPRPYLDGFRWLGWGTLQIVVGQVLLALWRGSPAAASSFWVDHSVLVLLAFPLAFDGGNTAATGFFRLLGSNVLDLAQNPLLAVTPADFWRRYNRNAGQFFAEDVYKVVGGMRHPVRGILAAFATNAILHEYIFTIAIGRVTWWVLVFFGLQALAVILTYRLRVRSTPAKVAGVVLTFAFNVLTAVFFFGPAAMFIPWYTSPPLLR